MREALDYKAADPFPEGWFCGEVHCGDDRGESPWIQGHRGGLRMEERKNPLGESGERAYFGDTIISKENYILFRKFFNDIPVRFDAKDYQNRWIWEHVIPVGTTMLYGESGSFKTFVCIDIAFHVAMGLPIGGYPVRRGIVLFFAGEGEASLGLRFLAWAKANEVSEYEMCDIRNRLFIAPISKVSGLVFTDGHNEVFSDIERILGMSAKDANDKVSLIIIDTKSKFSRGSENDPSEAVHFTNACDTIANRYDCAVLFTHHTPKGNTETFRGSTIHIDNTDTVIFAKRQEGRMEVTCTVQKQRDGDYFEWEASLEKEDFQEGFSSLSVKDVSSLRARADDRQPCRPQMSKAMHEKYEFAKRFYEGWGASPFNRMVFKEFLEHDELGMGRNSKWITLQAYESQPSSLFSKLLQYGFIIDNSDGTYSFSAKVIDGDL